MPERELSSAEWIQDDLKQSLQRLKARIAKKDAQIAELKKLLAELKLANQDLALCEGCGQIEEHSERPRYCHTCQQKLVEEIISLESGV